jgi:hypothetical protein
MKAEAIEMEKTPGEDITQSPPEIAELLRAIRFAVLGMPLPLMAGWPRARSPLHVNAISRNGVTLETLSSRGSRQKPQHPPQPQHSLDRMLHLLRLWRLL